jgi:hypothetical protein
MFKVGLSNDCSEVKINNTVSHCFIICEIWYIYFSDFLLALAMVCDFLLQDPGLYGRICSKQDYHSMALVIFEITV